MIEWFVYGALGGIVRAFIGAFKNSRLKGLDWKATVVNFIGAALVGGTVGLLVDKSIPLAIVSGYVGIDLIEGLVKAKTVGFGQGSKK